MTFDDLSMNANIRKAIGEMGFETPSPIQAQALPVLLGEPTDFVGLAATGTGKTAAFAIPLLEQVDPKKKVTQALVLCPTRELALQVAGQINLLGKHMGVRALSVYGGADYAIQIHGLKNGVPIVVGTPGRLIDHLDRGNLKLENIQTLVLDEADEMISMGFKEDLEKLLQSVERSSTKVWLFSATMGGEVSRVASTYLDQPQQVQVNRKEMLSETVEQIFYPTRESDKAEVLCKVIENADDFYGLIFCQTKSLVSDLASFLIGRNYKVDSLHGDKSQNEREKTMRSFRDKNVRILVCTDVASRGLDVKDVTHVINYSLPRELENYVHRIGRTARSGKTGIAISLVTPSHRNLIRRIEDMTRSRITECRVPSKREIGTKKVSRLLPQFMGQERHSLASTLLGEDWISTLERMPKEEIVGRFLTLISPEVFDDREKVKAVLGAFAGGRRNEERVERGPRRNDRREPSRRRNPPRGSGRGRYDNSARMELGDAPNVEKSEKRAFPKKKPKWAKHSGKPKFGTRRPLKRGPKNKKPKGEVHP